MLDIYDILEKDKLFYFMDSLLHDVVIKLQRRKLQNLANVATTTKWLFYYDVGFLTSMKSNGNASPSSSGSGGQASRNGKSKS